MRKYIKSSSPFEWSNSKWIKYIDDRQLFVKECEKRGITDIKNLDEFCNLINEFGFVCGDSEGHWFISPNHIDSSEGYEFTTGEKIQPTGEDYVNWVDFANEHGVADLDYFGNLVFGEYNYKNPKSNMPLDTLNWCLKKYERVKRYNNEEPFTINSSRRISSSQKGMENVAEETKYDDYHIDTNGMGILSVENIIEEIEGRGNQAVLTVQTSDGSTNHSQFGSKDWKEYKDSANDAGNSITDVWVTEVESGSYVRNSRRPIKSGFVEEHGIYHNDTWKLEVVKLQGNTAMLKPVKEDSYFCVKNPEIDEQGDLIWTSDTLPMTDYETALKEFNYHKDLNGTLPTFNSRRPVKSARYIATDPESGEVLGSADTYEEAVNEWGEDVTITDSESDEGNDEHSDLFSSRKITSAVDGGWEVRSSDVPEALDLFVEYFGKEDALEEIAKAMGDNTLEENIDYIAQQWGFAEELEDYDNAWDKYESAKEIMGEEQLFDNLTQAAGYDELAEDLAFIFRMYDFREWKSKYDEDEDEGWEEDDEEIESSLKNSFPIKTVKNVMSGLWTEERAAQNIAAKQDVNVGYARELLASWMETYKPKLIKSGILDIAEDINTEFDIDGDLESWAEQYTNDSGKSNTVGGEMVRAAMQIIYRYNNDGDMIGRGYGNETVNAAARYITEKAEMSVNEQIQKWLDHEERADDYDYDNFIETFTTEIEQILRENPELFQKPNKDDYWNWKTEDDVDVGFDECYLDDGSGNQYWFQKASDDRWTCTGIELDPYSHTYSEGDTINEGDELSDEILSPGEEFGSFEAEGLIYEYSGEDWDEEREQYTSWQITKVTPADPYCDEGDTFDFYDLEPDELYGYTLFDHNGNEIDERTFLASSLITSRFGAGKECIIEIDRHKDNNWEMVAEADDERGWTLMGRAKVFADKNEAKNSQLMKDLERAGYSVNKGNLKISEA